MNQTAEEEITNAAVIIAARRSLVSAIAAGKISLEELSDRKNNEILARAENIRSDPAAVRKAVGDFYNDLGKELYAAAKGKTALSR